MSTPRSRPGSKPSPGPPEAAGRAWAIDAEGEEVVVFELPTPAVHYPDGLTPAERAVAELVVEGCDNSTIAERRGVSVSTVANQLSRLFVKLGVRSRGELVRLLTQPR